MSINRRNFLAFIPVFGALPFVTEDIFMYKDKIEITKPRPVEIINPKEIGHHPGDLMGCKIYLCDKEDNVISQGFPTSISMSVEWDRRMEITIEGQLDSL